MSQDPAGISSFFETFGEIHSRLVKATAECTDPAMADLFRNLAAQMESTGTEFRAVATNAVEEAQRQFKETQLATEAALAKGRETVNQLRSLAEQNREFLKNAPKQPNTDSKKPSPSVPKVKSPKMKMWPLDFSSGDLLRDWLLPADAPKASSIPHTHGNIWDNWKAVPPPLSGQEDGLLEDDTE